jgi:2-hydroxycyclohexanecarboxyl-CoA dehydrogenase
MRSKVSLSGAHVLVTGAGRGIGRETALCFAREGSIVHCADIDEESAGKTAADCGGASYEMDVSDAASVEGVADRVHSEVGAIDVLVNNAGVGASGRFLDMSKSDWDWIMSINFMGVVNSCRVFAPQMVERRRGHVVNVSSGLAYTPTAIEPAYGASKAAVLALSRSLRNDWQRAGVRVTAVCPGVIDTPIVDHTRYLGAEADPKKIARTKKLFRHGHPPESVAKAIVQSVGRNRAVVLVGAEAKFGWHAQRLLPIAVTERFGFLDSRLR